MMLVKQKTSLRLRVSVDFHELPIQVKSTPKISYTVSSRAYKL